MGLSTYVMFLFATSVVFYMFGYTNIFTSFAEQTGVDMTTGASVPISIWDTVKIGLFNAMTDPLVLSLLAISTIASVFGAMSGGGSIGLLLVLPIFILTSFINIFILPLSFLLQADIPFFIKAIMGVWLQLWLILTVIEFIRSGST